MARVEFGKKIASWTEYLIHLNGTLVNEAGWEKGSTLWQFEYQIFEYARLKSTRTSPVQHEGTALASCSPKGKRTRQIR